MDFSVNGRQVRKSAGTTSKRLAKQIYCKLVALVAEGKYLDVKKAAKIRFADFSKEYMERHSKVKKKSWVTDTHFLKRLKPFFGGDYLFTITQKRVEDYLAERRESVCAATINREMTVLKSMFSKVIEWGHLDGNPCAKLKKSKEAQRKRFFSKEEITRLYAQCSPKLLEVCVVLINTGPRKGELRNLKWSDLDFDRNEIRLAETKNGEDRCVEMNRTVKDIFLRRRIRMESSVWLFPGENGSKPYDFHSAFKTARRKAGLEDVRIHDLRHTFASHLVMSGADLLTVAELLGHKDLQMTKRYSHLTKQHKADAVARLENRFSTNLAQSGVDPVRQDFSKIVSQVNIAS